MLGYSGDEKKAECGKEGQGRRGKREREGRVTGGMMNRRTWEYRRSTVPCSRETPQSNDFRG